MLTHLSDTLEVRSYLNHAGAHSPLTELAIESLEKFLSRLVNAPFKLYDADEAEARLTTIRDALAAVSLADPASIVVSTQSLESLLAMDPAAQMLVYAVAEEGSVARVIETTPKHRERCEALPPFKIRYQGGTRNIGIERRLRTLLNANGLKQVLRASQYGASFTKIFEKGVVSYYTALFAHAIAGDASLVERLLPLAKIFRSNMPVGRYPAEQGTLGERWLVFVR